VLYGCAVSTVELPSPAEPGHIVVRAGVPGAVVAAPHGSIDPRTGDIAAEIARRTGFGLVVATGFAIETDAAGRPLRRYQVNRPMEGVPGRPRSEEVVTDAARRVYQAYERLVLQAAGGPLRFYAEVHGNGHRDTAGRIEIATVGVDGELAARLRTLVELIRDAYLRARPEAPRLQVLVEPADTIRYAASGAKRDGILRLPVHALHIELPRSARTEWREVYTAVLADFVAEARALLESR